jgi:hypothetical protein
MTGDGKITASITTGRAEHGPLGRMDRRARLVRSVPVWPKYSSGAGMVPE